MLSGKPIERIGNSGTMARTTTYTYNGDDVLTSQTTGTTTTRYTQDLAAPLSQVLQVRQGGATTDYLYGVTRLAAVSGSTRTWYVGDALGSVRQTVSDTGRRSAAWTTTRGSRQRVAVCRPSG